MADRSAIEWTDATWNPIRGCSRVSPGCVNCYAEKVAARFSGPGLAYEGLTNAQGRWNGVVREVPKHLADPLRWREPRRIFVNSMSDLFHESLSFESIAKVYGVMACAPQHTFQILTKRPERFAAWEAWIADQAEALKAGTGDEPPAGVDARASACVCIAGERPPHGSGVLSEAHWRTGMRATWPLPNVWLGVSVEDQQRADERIPLLLDTPAAVRFLSVEPLLGPVDLRAFAPFSWEPIPPAQQIALREAFGPRLPDNSWNARAERQRVAWVIVGGESGAGSRPCDVAWIRGVVEQCAAADVPCFVKQLGARPIACGTTSAGGLRNIRDRKGGDPEEWPSDLRVRLFPHAAAMVTP